MQDGGVKQALIIGGGREPAGKFDSSFQLLETGYFENMKIGIAGHPEGSPDISETDLDKAMIDKKPCLLYTSPSPRDGLLSRMPSSA